MNVVGVECGRCGGQVFMHTCENGGGQRDHITVMWSECQKCGRVNVVGPCPECGFGLPATVLPEETNP